MVHSPILATLEEPNFCTFSYKTWRTVYMKNKTFAPLEGDGRVTLPAGIIGTLSNDDDDNSNNVKKQLVL